MMKLSENVTSLQKEYAQLLAEVLRHDHLYYVGDSPEISDSEYDQLMRRLRRMEEEHPELRAVNSPTQRVGGEVLEKFEKVKHPERMLSLDNIYSPKELEEFAARVVDGLGHEPSGWVVEPKIDGLSIELSYERDAKGTWQLVSAATRGDGEYGEEVVHNIRTVRVIPMTFADSAPFKKIQRCTIRGEIYLEKAALEEVNVQRQEEGEPLFKNCRNAAAGSVRLLDSRITAKRPLKFFVWGIVDGEVYGAGHQEVLELLGSLGFPINPRSRFCRNMSEVEAFISEFEVERHRLPYPVDGLVVKVNRFIEQRDLGITSKYPRFSIAYKYDTEKAVTRVREIRVQVGRTGTLTPVAEFDPVQVSGSVVSRASLHNEDEIARKDVRAGDWVEIEKAGEVIPQIVRVLTERRPVDQNQDKLKQFKMPEKCPSCGAKVVRDEEAVARRCSNRTGCPAQLREALLFFASRDAMNIERLGPALVDQLLMNKQVKDLADLYLIKKESLLELERMADKSADNVMQALAISRRDATLADFITGLGIPHVGRVAAQLLAKHFGSIDAMLAAGSGDLQTELQNIHGIGPVMASSIAEYLGDATTQALLKKFKKIGLDPQPPQAAALVNGPLSGMSFCITGTLSLSRDAFRKKIESLGGTFHDSVKKETTYLLKGEGPPSSKEKQADKHGVKKISEAEFQQLAQRQ